MNREREGNTKQKRVKVAESMYPHIFRDKTKKDF